MARKLSHYDDSGRARMVDVSAKAPSKREAEASAFVRMSPAVLKALPDNAKGDPLEVARIAFRIVRQSLQHRGTHAHKGTGFSLALAGRFGGDVYHPGAAGVIVMRKLPRHAEYLSYMGCGRRRATRKPELVGDQRSFSYRTMQELRKK